MELAPYADLLDRARRAFATDPAYAIEIAQASGTIIGKRAARLGLSIAEYDEHAREQREVEEQRATERRLRLEQEQTEREAARAARDAERQAVAARRAAEHAQRVQRRLEAEAARLAMTRRARHLHRAGRSYASIARELGCAVGSVGTILRRALPEDAEG